MALTNERLTGFAGLIPARGTYPIAANVRIFKGAMVAIDSAGRARPGGLIAAGSLAAIGKASAEYDNRTGSALGGAAGAVEVEVEYGVFDFDLDSNDPPTKPGVVFMVDDHTVSDDSDTDTRGIAGYCSEIRNGKAHVWMGPHVESIYFLAGAEAAQLDEAQSDIADLEAAGNRTRAASMSIPARDATDEFDIVVERVAVAGTVTGAHITSTGNVTGNNTNNAQFLLQRVRAGTPATIATLTLLATTGDLVVNVPKSMGSLTNTALLAGDVLKLVVTENGDGLITPNATISVTVENTLATA